jgi:hypothetical protein
VSGLTLEEVLPWGRCFDEYVRMFDLGEEELKLNILSCADGPAAFNAEMRRRGRRMISADPLYAFSSEAIRGRIDASFDAILEQLHNARDDYLWHEIRSPEHLGRVRMAAMEDFLKDLPDGAREGRYVAASLPRLPFADTTFDLALCSHLLFTYSDQLSAQFHLKSIIEMSRVAREVRIFPLVSTQCRRSSHLSAVQNGLIEQGYGVFIQPVPYEFQVNGNQMMVVRRGRA